MMKWLRVHSKKIMVAVVLLAMLSFVGGPALYNLFQTKPSDIKVMDVLGTTYTMEDVNNAAAETEILDGLFIDWTSGLGRNETTPRHWLMLALEAEKAGIDVSAQEVNEFLDDKDKQMQQFNAGSVAELRKSRHYSMSSIRNAVARQLAIQRNYSRVFTAAIPSEPQVRHYVRATADKVAVSMASLDAKHWVDATEPLDEAEVQAQFDKYKDVLAAESPTGFGYKYPRRVRLQFVSASVARIESQIQIGLEEIKTQWKANPQKYTKTIMVDAPPTSAPATTQPVKPQQIPKSVTMTFSEARGRIEQELRKNKANRVVRTAMTRLAEEMARPWTELKVDPETGYRSIPKEVESAAYFKDVAAQVAGRLGITLDVHETAIISAEDIENNFALRGAETPGDDDKPLKISEYAFRVPGFYKPKDENDSSLRLQLFQTPVVAMAIPGPMGYTIENGRVVQKAGEPSAFVLFRVMETSESQSPTSLAEVRAKVEADVRLMHAFARVEPIATELCAVAQRLGIDTALTKFDDLRDNRGVRSTSKQEFARMSQISDQDQARVRLTAGRSLLDFTNIPGIGQSAEFIDACFDMTAEGWQAPNCNAPDSPIVQAATTQPAISPAPKVRMVPIEKTHRWLVVELTAYKPVNSDAFATEQRKTAYQQIMSEKSVALRMAWFDTKKIEERCDFIDRSEGNHRAGTGFNRPEAPLPPMGY